MRLPIDPKKIDSEHEPPTTLTVVLFLGMGLALLGDQRHWGSILAVGVVVTIFSGAIWAGYEIRYKIRVYLNNRYYRSRARKIVTGELPEDEV